MTLSRRGIVQTLLAGSALPAAGETAVGRPVRKEADTVVTEVLQ